MDDKPKEKRQYYAWSKESLTEALKKLKGKVIGLNECSRLYGIPKPTLKRHLEKQSDEICKGRPTVFSQKVENEIAKHLLNLEHCMFGLTSSDVRRLAFQIAEKNNIQHNFNKNKQMAGKCWFYKFMKRHPELSLRAPESTSINRVKGFNKENVFDFYDKLEKVIAEHGITSNTIFNVDETGVSTVQKRTQKVVGQKGKKQVGSIASGERGVNTTAVCASSAAGQFIPPMLIFKRKRMCIQLEKGKPPGSIIRVSDSGYINSELFVVWLKHFIQIVRPSPEKKVLLLLDGHTTHSKNLEAINIARENGIILLQLPGHTTHRLQPMDVAVFGPLNTYYIQEVETWLRTNAGKPVTQFEVAHLFNKAYQKVATVGNAVSGFRATGVWPVDRHVFQDHHFLPAETFRDQNDSNEPNDANEFVLPKADSTIPNEGSQTPNQTENQVLVEADKMSDVTDCESPTIFEMSSQIHNMNRSIKLGETAQGAKCNQPKILQSIVLNYINCDLPTLAQLEKSDTPGNVTDKPNVQSKSKVYNDKMVSFKDIVNFGASCSKQSTLNVPINVISPLPKKKQTINKRKRGVQKTLILTASPYKQDLEQSIQKRAAKVPKIKLEKPSNIKKSATKNTKNKTPKKNESGNSDKKKKILKKQKKRKASKKIISESSETEEDDEVISLDDESDDLDSDYDNYCTICDGWYFDENGPRVEWMRCVRCQKWLHITCSENPDICPKCLI